MTLKLCAAFPSSRQPGILIGPLRLVRVKGTCVLERSGAGCKVAWRHVQRERVPKCVLLIVLCRSACFVPRIKTVVYANVGVQQM